jgi:two-component system sensor histidine kinase UhpB
MATALGIARNENKALIRHSLAIQEEERRNLARELHDEFGQCLTAIKVMSATLRQPGEAPGSPAGQIMGLCDRLFGVVRAMLRRLRPMVLEDLGLAAALEDLAEQWRTSHPDLRIHLDCAPAVAELSGDLALQLFRSIQECLTNIVKHAHAREVWIDLTQNAAHAINVTVRDDGRGFTANRPGRGFGLSGIRERVAGLGGHLTLDTRPGHGVTVRIVIPRLEAIS